MTTQQDQVHVLTNAMIEEIQTSVSARMNELLETALFESEHRVLNKVVDSVQEIVAEVAPRVEKIVVGLEPQPVKIKGTTHEVFQRVLKLASIRRNILLVGPAGCGKTYLAKQVADTLKLRFGATSFAAGTSESHLQGYLLPVEAGGKFAYVSSVFVDLYENGGAWLGDELDGADENMLLTMNAALANGRFYLPQRVGNHEVKKHKDFVCIAAANTFGHGADMVYAGRNKLDGATLDRFRAGIVRMGYDLALEKQTVDADVLAWGHAIRSKIDEYKMRRIMSTRVLQDFTENKQRLGDTVKDWERSYFADWTRDELTRVGRDLSVLN